MMTCITSRHRVQKEFYTLRTRQASIHNNIITGINSEEAHESSGKHKSLLLTSSLLYLSLFISKQTQVRAIHIELNKEWLARYFKMDVYDDILKE